jgi:hypothetical protein
LFQVPLLGVLLAITIPAQVSANAFLQLMEKYARRLATVKK